MLLPIILLLSSPIYAQKILRTEKVTDWSSHLIGDDFSGVVFAESYTNERVSLTPQNGKIYAIGSYTMFQDEIQKCKRFTPSEDDISATESALQSQLKAFNKKLPKINLVGGPDVYKNLKKYSRQYFGFVNERGEKIIFINSIWNEILSKDESELTTEFFQVFDGGNRFWQAKINITTHKLFNFCVNGAID